MMRPFSGWYGLYIWHNPFCMYHTIHGVCIMFGMLMKAWRIWFCSCLLGNSLNAAIIIIIIIFTDMFGPKPYLTLLRGVIFLNFAERPKALFKETIMPCHLCHSTFQCNAMHGVPLIPSFAGTISRYNLLQEISVPDICIWESFLFSISHVKNWRIFMIHTATTIMKRRRVSFQVQKN